MEDREEGEVGDVSLGALSAVNSLENGDANTERQQLSRVWKEDMMKKFDRH
jgi:hypothetical protein